MKKTLLQIAKDLENIMFDSQGDGLNVSVTRDGTMIEVSILGRFNSGELKLLAECADENNFEIEFKREGDRQVCWMWREEE